MKRIRDYFLRKLNATAPLQGKVLEVGCGDGRLSLNLAPRCKILTGIDPDRTKIEQARIRGIRNAAFLQMRAESIVFSSKWFDAVVFGLSLHHVPVPLMHKAINEAIRVTKFGGYIVFLEPAFKGSFFEAEIFFDACDGDERAAKHAAHQAIIAHPGLEGFGHFFDETVFQFDGVGDFIKEMKPKQNLDKLEEFLKKRAFRLNAERRIDIYRPRK
jgi:ubiquinone/menaquinone biosynthesis C-methylase UbiE